MAQEWDRETPWRQGHLLPSKVFIKLFPKKSAEGYNTAIVISHDCDLTQSPEKEPVVEIAFCKFTEILDGNNAGSKSSRQLHLPLKKLQPNVILDILAVDKSTIDKAKLFANAPDRVNSLATEELRTLRQWLSNRYARSSFSNEFDRLLKASKFIDQLTKIVKPLGSTLEAIYFDVDDEDEIDRTDGDPPFELTIYLRYTLQHDEEGESKTTEAAKKIRALFKQVYFDKVSNCWRGVELKNCFVSSNHSMTVADHQKLRIWDTEYLSLRAEPQQQAPKR